MMNDKFCIGLSSSRSHAPETVKEIPVGWVEERNPASAATQALASWVSQAQPSLRHDAGPTWRRIPSHSLRRGTAARTASAPSCGISASGEWWMVNG